MDGPIHTAEQLQQLTKETLNNLQHSKQSLHATITESRRVIRTSHDVMRQAAALLTLQDGGHSPK